MADRERLVISFDDDPPPAVPSRSRPAAPPAATRYAAPDVSLAPSRPPVPVAAPGYGAPVVAVSGLAFANWGQRLAAVLIDGVLLVVGSIPIALLIGAMVGGSSGIGGLGILAAYFAWSFAILVAGLIYYPVMLSRGGSRNGQTLGKQALNIRVQNVDGRPITGGQAFLREVVMKQLLIYGLGSLLIYIPPLLDSLWPLWHPNKQSWHDMASSTVVVQDPR